MEWAKILEAIRLKRVHLLALFFAASGIIFLPESIQTSIGLADFRLRYLPLLGATWLLSGATLVAHLVEPGLQLLGQNIKRWRALQTLKAKLSDLSPREKEILRQFLGADSKTVAFPIDDGAISALHAQGILFRSGQVSQSDLLSFDFNIQPWAWTYLKANPQLIDWDGKVSKRQQKKNQRAENDW